MSCPNPCCRLTAYAFRAAMAARFPPTPLCSKSSMISSAAPFSNASKISTGARPKRPKASTSPYRRSIKRSSASTSRSARNPTPPKPLRPGDRRNVPSAPASFVLSSRLPLEQVRASAELLRNQYRITQVALLEAKNEELIRIRKRWRVLRFQQEVVVVRDPQSMQSLAVFVSHVGSDRHAFNLGGNHLGGIETVGDQRHQNIEE